MAFGTAVSGHPLQSDESSISVDAQIGLLACSAAPSRAQIETHATSSHTKLIGSKQAMSFLSKTRVKNIFAMIAVEFDSRHWASSRLSRFSTEQGVLLVDGAEGILSSQLRENAQPQVGN